MAGITPTWLGNGISDLNLTRFRTPVVLSATSPCWSEGVVTSTPSGTLNGRYPKVPTRRTDAPSKNCRRISTQLKTTPTKPFSSLKRAAETASPSSPTWRLPLLMGRCKFQMTGCGATKTNTTKVGMSFVCVVSPACRIWVLWKKASVLRSACGSCREPRCWHREPVLRWGAKWNYMPRWLNTWTTRSGAYSII